MSAATDERMFCLGELAGLLQRAHELALHVGLEVVAEDARALAIQVAMLAKGEIQQAREAARMQKAAQQPPALEEWRAHEPGCFP